MHDRRTVLEFRVDAVRLWLVAAAAMIFLTLVVGGAARLTVSGLSIVEWQPVTGVLPPLSESAWQTEFEKYKQIPQYHKLNRGMSLSQFRVIRCISLVDALGSGAPFDGKPPPGVAVPTTRLCSRRL